MRAIVKWSAAAVLLLLLTGAIAGVALWRTVAPSSGSLAVAGLSQDVSVVRDANAIPHIEAATYADAARALGFVHAQERLWQMETLRRTAQGRLAELFGEPAVEFDVFLRTLGMDRAAASSFDALEPETRATLDAYAAGVNAWVSRERALLDPGLPPEFLIFGNGFEPWRGKDSVAVMKLMSLQLSKNLGDELQRLNLASRGFSSAEIADLMPSHSDDDAPPLPDLRELLPLRPARDVQSREADAEASSFLAPPVSQWASNSWVVGGSRTVSGAPLLANDPHLAFGAPSLWYLAHLRWRENGDVRNLIGASLPGTPLVLLGRTDRIAWGLTNAGADVQDIFVERTKAGDPTQYLTPDGWKAFDTRTEVIAVADADPVRITVRTTRHGPVLPDTLPVPSDRPTVFSNLLTELYVPALKWTALAEDDRTFDSLLAMTRARSTEEFVASLDRVVSPMQAIVVADIAGDLALVTPARVPVRAAANRVAGRAPVPGWLAEYDWTGTVAPADVPQPTTANDAFVTANTRLPNADGLHLTYDWDEPYRLKRAEDVVVRAGTKLDIGWMMNVQYDTRSAPLADLRDRLLALHEPEAPYGDTLRSWNGRMDRNERAPLLMMAWARHLIERALADDLDGAFPAFDDINHHAIDNILRGGARDWCDDRTTERIETCAETVRAAWDDALADLRERYGDDPDEWIWGRAHYVRNAHQPFSKVPVLRWLFDVERPASGGPHTPNRGRTSIGSDEPYASTHGAGYKAIYDLSNPERSMFIQTTGQSGNPFSRHYRRFATLWADGGYLPMVTDPAIYREDAIGTWTLRATD